VYINGMCTDAVKITQVKHRDVEMYNVLL